VEAFIGLHISHSLVRDGELYYRWLRPCLGLRGGSHLLIGLNCSLHGYCFGYDLYSCEGLYLGAGLPSVDAESADVERDLVDVYGA